MKNLSEQIGYNFKDESLFEHALTHSSYVRERNMSKEFSNERLEFLGDGFFDAIIAEELFRRLPASEEGNLTKIRSQIVCTDSLAEKGRKLELGRIMKLGRGEANMGGREKTSIIADAMEALIGAVFLDGGYDAAREYVLKTFQDTIDEAIAGKINRDYKSCLQEKLQRDGSIKISYMLEKEEGPDHAKTFYVKVEANGRLLGRGKGKNKKEAEQNAAKEAMASLEGETINVF